MLKEARLRTMEDGLVSDEVAVWGDGSSRSDTFMCGVVYPFPCCLYFEKRRDGKVLAGKGCWIIERKGFLSEEDCYIRRSIIALLRSATCCLWYGFAMDAVTKARQSRCYSMLTHWRGIILHENSFMRSLLYHAEGTSARSGKSGLTVLSTRRMTEFSRPLNKRISQISESFTKPK